jgi:hypothetical protein
MLEQWAEGRADFEAVRQAVTVEPRILRIERDEGGALSVLPSGASRERVGALGSLMQRLGIASVSADAGPEPGVDILMFEHAGHDRYESRMFTYRPLDPPSETVASIDRAILSDPNSDHTMFRPLGEGWYIRATSMPVFPRR